MKRKNGFHLTSWGISILIMTSCISQNKKDMIGPWKNMEGNYGVDFGVKEDVIAGTQDIHLSLWQGHNLVKVIRAESKMGGYPRIVDSRVYWGNGYYDISAQDFTAIPNIDSIFSEGTDTPAFTSSQGQYLPHTYAWSPDGSFVLASIYWSGQVRPMPSRALLIHRDGGLEKVIWEGNGPPPKSALLTQSYIILGGKNASVYDYLGSIIKTLAGELETERMEMDDKESLLLVQNYHNISIWETTSWTKLDSWKGPWLDASLSPSGEMIGSIDFKGKLHLAHFNKKIKSVRIPEIADPMETIKIGENKIIGTFSRGHPIRETSLITD